MQSVPDFATLRSLVHTCPAYHQAYLAGNKEQILSAVIERQHIRGTEVDALGAVLSPEYTSGLQDQEDETIAFLDRYRHARGAGGWAEPNNTAPVRLQQTRLDNLMMMLRFQHCVQHLTEDFLEWVGHSDRGRMLTKVDGRIPLSLMEEMRIHRAMYRLQIYSHLFGTPASKLRRRVVDDYPELKIWSLFFQTFPPWELQELAVIWEYVSLRGESLLDELTADPNKDIPKLIPDGR